MKTWRYTGRRLRLTLWFGFCCALSVNRGTLATGETLSRQFPMKSGGRLTLETTRGDIRISSWAEDRVDLTAETTGDPKEDMKLVPVDIQAKEDEIRITSLYPVYAPNLRVRVDYSLRVPRQVDLKWLRSVNGDVSVSDVSGRAIILVGNGGIIVEGFSGLLKATSTNGRIEVDVAKVDEGGSMSLKNYNEDISLRLPRNVKAHWDVRTLNGKIESSLPFTILDNFGPEVVHLSEREDPVIQIYSVNGDIRITER